MSWSDEGEARAYRRTRRARKSAARQDSGRASREADEGAGVAPSGAGARRVEGWVLQRSIRDFEVRTPDGDRRCFLSGRLLDGEQPVVGDRVQVALGSAGAGLIESILPRRNALRRVAEEDGSKTRTIAANVDRLVLVLSVSPFPPRWALADRLLALCEAEGFEALIVVNKMDLLSEHRAARAQLDEAIEVYRDLGLMLLLTSALDGSGIAELESALHGAVNVFAGHSGVGKSSLLNRLHPEWRLRVGDVNPSTHKGRHTTSAARLLELPGGAWVVDTPGFREFGLGQIAASDLGRCYREFRPIISGCRFADCLHDQEPGCALRHAVESGRVAKLRYQNYLLILRGLVEMG
jgi:ribosome biogenesis GTPase